MSTHSSSWFIPGKGKQPAGPFTAEQIIQWWKIGRLDENTICWQEGMSQWLPLSIVEPFASTIQHTVSTGRTGGGSAELDTVSPPQPSSRAGRHVNATASATSSRTPVVLRLLPFIRSIVAVVIACVAYLLIQEPSGKDQSNISAHEDCAMNRRKDNQFGTGWQRGSAR